MTDGLTIWQQLTAGTKMATGARQALYGERDIHFTVGKGKEKVRVELASDDTYTVQLWRFKSRFDLAKVQEQAGAYAENLNDTVYRLVNR
jgi:hypothetical protein